MVCNEGDKCRGRKEGRNVSRGTLTKERLPAFHTCPGRVSVGLVRVIKNSVEKVIIVNHSKYYLTFPLGIEKKMC